MAEVPQIDFESWHPVATRLVEEHVIKTPLSSFRVLHPERLSLLDRLRHAAFIPPIHIVSNSTDKLIADQRAFIHWCQTVDLPRAGDQVLEVTDLVSGHKALPKEQAIARIVP